MKLFGEFLVEKKAVSESQLLGALMEQIEHTPSLPVILYKQSLLPHSKILKALAYQAKNSVDFKSACQQLGFWDSEIEKKVEDLLFVSQVPIGQILLQKGVVTSDVLLFALDEYFSKKDEQELKITSLPSSCLNALSDLKMAFARGIGFSELYHLIHFLKGSLSFYQLDSYVQFCTELELLCLKSDQSNDLSQEIVSLGLEMIQEGRVKEEDIVGFSKKAKEVLEKNRNRGKDPLLRILVVDDSKSVHAFVKECCAQNNWSIADVFDGQQAIELLKNNSEFDLILLDWEMPHLTGPQTFEEFKKNNIRIPVIMMTSRNSVEDISQMINAGVSEYIMKPFTQDIFIEKIKGIIGEKL